MDPLSHVNSVEEGMQHVHLLLLRRQYADAEYFLNALDAKYPGNTEVTDLLQRISTLDRVPGAGPTRTNTSIWNRTFPSVVAYPILLCLACCALGGFMVLRALRAAMTKGLAGNMEIDGKLRVMSVPIAGQLTRGIALLMIAACCAGIATWQVKRATRRA